MPLTLRSRSTPAVLALALALATPPGLARADDTGKATCVEAHSEAQRLKNRGKLLDARDRLGACATDECPDLVAKDCAEWLAEMGSTIPSVVVRAVDGAGRETADVAVLIDGVRIADRLDGRAIEIDPGERTFRFEATGGAVVEQKVLVSEGERRRPIELRFPPPKPRPPPPPRPRPPREHGVSAATWILGGVALAGLGVFTGFAISGRARQDDLEMCAPSCLQVDVDGMRTRYLVADIGLVAGLVSGGVATWFAFE